MGTRKSSRGQALWDDWRLRYRLTLRSCGLILCPYSLRPRFLSGFYQAVAALPGFFQSRPDSRFFFGCGFGVGAGYELGGLHFGHLEQRSVAQQVGDAKVRHAGLASPEELARSAQLEIELSEFEAVLGADHRGEPFLALGRFLSAGHKNAVGLRSTATN